MPRNTKNTQENRLENDLYVIAVGASAGGLEAIQDLLSHYPASLKNAAIIIAQHLSPTHKSMLVQLLSKETNLHVEEATNGKELSPNVVYITPPNSDISIAGKEIRLTKPLSAIGPKPSVDILFSAVARAFRTKAIAVILSGTGSDGGIGVGAVKKLGGFVIVQEPESAKFNGMPNIAIETGMADMILSPGRMGSVIEQHIRHPGNDISNALEGLAPSAAWDNIFNLLSKHKGTDFSHYKPSTIGRRLTKRLGILKLKSPENYYEYLKENPVELDELFSIFLISVTNFFRDTDAFEMLETVLSKIIQVKEPKDSIRVWVAACATGEEAYSIAILLANILKEKIADYNIQIFATDIDEKAIQFARRGIYDSKSLEGIPAQLRQSYFIKTDDGFEITKQIKSIILFSKHDVASNPPFLKLDLLSCRNLLIYFDDILQKQIFPIFHYALNTDAFLFLGRAESIGQFGSLFKVVDEKNKLFQRKPGDKRPIKFTNYSTPIKLKPALTGAAGSGPQSIKELVKETLFNTYEHAYVVIDEDHNIQEVYGDVRIYLSFPEGGLNFNILKLVNVDLQIELRSVLARCIKEHQQIKSLTRKFDLFDKTYYLRITARPAIGEFKGNRYYIIIFEQVERDEFLYQVNPAILTDTSAVDMAKLEQELAATREHLQTYIEELETANEELQSLNEEMQSTNEELQSTNEELETTNEELQSTSEEVQITYSELKAAYGELQLKEEQISLNEANLNALLSNTLQVFYLIDNNYKIIAFNKRAEETVWMLYHKKIFKGNSVLEIINPESFEPFIKHFKAALGGQVVIGDTTLSDKAGNPVTYLYNYSPAIQTDGLITAVSVSYLDVTEARRIASNLTTTEKLLSSVFNTTATGMSVIDEEGVFADVNHAFCQLFNYERAELIGNNHAMLFAPEHREQVQQMHVEFIQGAAGNSVAEIEAYKKEGTMLNLYVSSELLIQDDGKRYKVKSVRDITAEKKAAKEIAASQAKYRAIVDNSPHAFFLSTKDGDILEANEAACKLIGYSEEEFKQIGRQSFIEHDAALNKKLKERNEKGYISVEAVAIKKNKQRIVCEFSSMMFKDINGEIRASTMLTDITDRKKNQKLLEDTNKLAKVGGWEYDLENNVIYWSEVVKQIHGVDEEFVPELHNTILFYKEGENRDKLSQLVENAIQTGETWDEELQIITAKGKEKWVRVSCTTEMKGKKVIRLYGATQDINEKKLAEEKLKDLNHQLHTNIKQLELSNTELEQFAYVASHDLQEPLRMVSSFMQLLEKKYDNQLDETGKQYIRFAVDGAARMKKLVLDLLEYSRVASLRETPGNCDMNEVMQEVLSTFNSRIEAAGAKIRISTSLPLLTNTRKTQMIQLVQNLLGNALKYRNLKKPEIIIDVQEADDKWLFSIKDNGIGFDNSYSERIFIIFQRLHNATEYSGTGIGLAICKKIIDMHGGKIWANSEPGKGSVFYFSLSR